MAPQDRDSTSGSESNVFIATTTGASGNSDQNTANQFRASQTSSFDPARTSDSQGGASTQDSGSQNQGTASSNFQSPSTSTQSGSRSSDSSNNRGQEIGNGRQDSDSHDSNNGGDHTVVIASVSAVVGTLIIALVLLLFFLKRRKKGTYSEIIRMRPGSKEITALPVYQLESDPVRASKTVHRPSMQDVRPTTASSAIANTRKFLSPPKASAMLAGRASFDVGNKRNTKKSTEMLQKAYGIRRHSSAPPMRHSEMKETHPIGLSAQWPLSSPKSNRSSNSSLDCPEARWSWTNSQAPSTPRIAAPNTRASLTGRSVRSVRSWFTGQGEDRSQSQQSHRGHQSHRRERSNPLLLKNQAHMPVLAPHRPAVRRPSSSLRAKAGRISESIASGRRSNASHRMEDQRPLSPLARPLSGETG